MPQNPQTDQHDFRRLFVQYQPRIYGYIRSLVADRSDAEDMLQERGIPEFRGHDI